MIWIVWALMLITHGAVTRWAKSVRSYAKISILGDALLMAIALITVDQLQDMRIADTLRIGLFFIAFGTAGRYLMASMLKGSPLKG